MSDTAIFIAATADDLKSNSGLPGDVNVLRNFTENDERVVHTELIVDAPVPGGFLNTLHQNGVWVTLLPRSGDADASVMAGLMTRLQEFAQTYPQVDRYILAGIETSRLSPVAAYLQRSGHTVLLCGPDRGKLDAARHDADDTEVWSGKDGGNAGRGNRDNTRDGNRDRGRETNRDSRSADKEKDNADPFEVLVEEVTKSRKRGHRVLLTSLKQRMRKRIRRFDETRLKDKDGRPMRKFKDFVVDAANRGLIQLIEKGNASHVLLPGEKVEADDDADDTRGGRRDDADDNGDEDDDDLDGVDPLLDSVDTVEGDDADNKDDDDNGDDNGDDDDQDNDEEEIEDILTPDDIDVDELDEEANPPPPEFMKVLEKILEKPKTLPELVEALVKKQESGDLEMKTPVLRKHLQHAFNNELLEAAGEEKPVKFLLVDDWQDIIDYL
ncbi:MAG: hypothetical protein JJU29_14460 [Verrucomicrobia bacterium]|nr:hypothetical protein [Verrucomicrobiota bacterium]MCH8513305.1 hypothetical protein [Kiritimatiellia bacterium]